jgi:predicted amidohydrolase
MKIALVQLSSSDDPAENLGITQGFVADAASQGADLILTPEVTNCVSINAQHQRNVLKLSEQDETLAAISAQAADLGVWVLIGSLAVKTDDPGGRFANRSFLINPVGEITAQYDKMHMFDVQLSETEAYRESSGYRAGEEAVLADVLDQKIGLTICYDLRFPALYRRLAQAGADIITVPSAFTVATGKAHWETLLRARAIECGCFILAPAQTGTHACSSGKPRKTYGHSLAVSPWGDILADGGEVPGVTMVNLDLSLVEKARHRIPSLHHDRVFEGPSEQRK